MKKFISFIYLLVGLFLVAYQANAQTQTVKGQIIDKDSKSPLTGVNVILLNHQPVIGATSDLNGFFSLKNVPIGRQALRFSFIGYKESTPSNLLVVQGKELIVNIEMEESVMMADEVVISAQAEKGEVNNDMASVSIRTFDLEEVSRYAGSRNDPARMAANFAGVNGANDSRNDIIIRGNSPSGVLWRLEGIDIPSPNHFSSFGSTGGPVNMLNNNLLAKSDFMTAAFPAQYGNSLAGVFDLQMRRGNNEKYEFLGQVGFNGFELGAEGPFSKKSKASFIVNYRYSTLQAFKAMGINLGTGTATPQYQDLSFKIDVPTQKAGKFTIFGVGGNSAIKLLGSETKLDQKDADLYGNENEDLKSATATGVIGASHSYFFNPTTSYKLVLAASQQAVQLNIDSITNDRTQIINVHNFGQNQTKLSANLSFNKKINVRNNLTLGIIADRYNINFVDTILVAGTWRKRFDNQGNSMLLQTYAQWQHKFNDQLTLNAGLHYQQFQLSNSNAVEPRLGLRYQLGKQSFSLGYGWHSQLQPLPLYFLQTLTPNGYIATNEKLGFARSHHFVAGYDRQLNANLRFKTEIYYQYITNAGIEKNATSFSTLNAGADFVVPAVPNLTNEGLGRNYGLELTAEKYFSDSYYFLTTLSLYKSEYQGSDNIWRSTAFDGGYVYNLLAGKEFKIGTSSTLAIDWKFTAAGGRKYTPIDIEKSRQENRVIYKDDEAFSEKLNDYIRTDLKISYRINHKRITQEFAFDIQNLLNRKNDFRKDFNRRTGQVITQSQLGLFPVMQYRILF